jgi:hypothetical protein
MWSDWFDDFELTCAGEETILVGSVINQAALLGMLMKIHDLGLIILLLNLLMTQTSASNIPLITAPSSGRRRSEMPGDGLSIRSKCHCEMKSTCAVELLVMTVL